MTPPSSNETCRKCGSSFGRLPAGALCARCLLEAGLSQFRLRDSRGDEAEAAGAGKVTTGLGQFGRYDLLQEIAHGGMGVVYRARDRSLNRVVALKLMLAGQFCSDREMKRFRAEAEAAARLDHPNIVAVYEVGEQHRRAFYSMKFMEGGTLTEQLAARAAPLKPREAAALLVKVARAVHYAHVHAILHRDLKPGNILLDGRGEPHVSDFGLAKCLDSADGLTLSGATLGSPAYMSPEQAGGQSELTTASDIYSLGALLFHLLTGRPPFEGPTPLATMKRVVEEEPPRPRLLNATVDRDLETICLKCLQKDPPQRYSSADALAEDLERWLKLEPIRARPITVAERVLKWMRRNPILAALIVLLHGVLLIGLAVILTESVRLAAAHRASQQANAQLSKTVHDFEWVRIDELIATGKRGYAIAYLSEFLRLNPGDRLAATRLIAMLGQCNFVLPAGAPLRHPAAVNTLALTADGQRVLTAADDGKVRLWDLQSTKLLRELPHPAEVTFTAFLADERRAVTTCRDGKSRVWDLVAGTTVFEFPHRTEGGLAALLSHDRHRLLIADTKTSMQLWDVRSFKPIGPSLDTGAELTRSAFSADDRALAIGSVAGLSLWNVETSQPLVAPLQLGPVTVMAFSPDGKLLAVTVRDKLLFLDPATGARLKEFQPHNSQLLWAEFTPDSRRLVTMAFDMPLKIWDVASTQMLGRTIEAEQPFAYFHLSPDGRRLATYSQNGVGRVWDAFTGQALTEPFEHEGSVTDLQFSPDGQFIVTTSLDGIAQRWDARVTERKSFAAPTTEVHPRACFSRDGTRLIRTTDWRAEILDLGSGQLIASTPRQTDEIYRIALSPDGTKFATAGWDRTGRVWDVATAQPLTPPLPHGGRLNAVAFSPDARLVATAASDATARLWDARTGQPVGPALIHHNEVLHLRFRPDSGALLTASVDTTARLWSTETGQPLWPQPIRHKGIVWTAEFSPDGRRVLTASADRSARIWDAETGRPLARPMLHERGVYSAQFSPDARWVLTCSEDGTARVWEAATGEPISQPMHHTSKLAHGAFSPDGRLVFTGSLDGVARFWDPQTGYALSEPLLHSGREITAVQFSPDGRRCLSVASVDAVRLWDVIEAPAPAPAWFCELVEAVGGKRMDTHGDVEVVSRDSIQTYRQRFAVVDGKDFYSRWAHWFLHERLQDPAPRFK